MAIVKGLISAPARCQKIERNVAEGRKLALRVRLSRGIWIYHKYQPDNRATCVTELFQQLAHCRLGFATTYTIPRRISPMSSVTSGRVCLILLSAGRGVAITKTLVMMFAAAV